MPKYPWELPPDEAESTPDGASNSKPEDSSAGVPQPTLPWLTTGPAKPQPAAGTPIQQPAHDPVTPVRHAIGLLVVGLHRDRIRRIVRFDPSVLARFGLPTILDAV